MKHLIIKGNSDNVFIPDGTVILTLSYLSKNIHIPKSVKKIIVLNIVFSFDTENEPCYELSCKKIYCAIPNTITKIIIEDNFFEILSLLHNNITHLTFGDNFNKKLHFNNLPKSLIYLKFGNKFNQPIKHTIPNTVVYLIFGHNFNQKINVSSIPNSVSYLSLGYSFHNNLGLLQNIKIFKTFCGYVDFPKNTLISIIQQKYSQHCDVFLNNNKCNFSIDKNIILECFINNDNITFIGKIIFEELTKYVFHPSRLLRYAYKYNLNFYEYLDFL